MKRAIEPTRQSVMDIVQENLRAAGTITHITRVIYIGEYFCSHEDLEKKVMCIIHDLQTDYTDVHISGLLLAYPQYYIHILEASEDIIYKHFKAIYNEKSGSRLFGKAIFLPSYHHVHQRFFEQWFYAYTVSPTMLDKLEAHSLLDIQKQMRTCLVKIYALCDYVANAVQGKTNVTNDILQYLRGKGAQYLPESTLLQFLLNLNTPVFQTIEDYVKLCTTVPYINLYNDSIWPPPRCCMLRSAFNKSSHRRSEYHSTIGQTSDNVNS